MPRTSQPERVADGLQMISLSITVTRTLRVDLPEIVRCWLEVDTALEKASPGDAPVDLGAAWEVVSSMKPDGFADGCQRLGMYLLALLPPKS